MSRTSSYTYDPATGEWTANPVSEGEKSTPTPKTESSSDGSNLTSTNPDKDSSTGSTEKQYNEIEINTLTGSLSYIANKKTIKLKAGDTVKLQGFGKHLSGDYYVEEITRTIDSNGYSHSATVMKPDFGKSLKIKSSDDSKVPTEQSTVPSTPTASTAQRTHTVVAGESLWAIAVKYYSDGSQWKKIYDANTGKIANPDLIYVGQVFVIP